MQLVVFLLVDCLKRQSPGRTAFNRVFSRVPIFMQVSSFMAIPATNMRCFSSAFQIVCRCLKGPRDVWEVQKPPSLQPTSFKPQFSSQSSSFPLPSSFLFFPYPVDSGSPSSLRQLHARGQSLSITFITHFSTNRSITPFLLLFYFQHAFP